jgi:hypothetical protein
MRYCNMIGQPYTIYIYKHRDSKPTLHLQEVNFVNFDPFLCISGCFESTLGTSQNWSLQNAWLNCIKSRFQDQEDVAENMVGRDICVIYMDIYISMSPSLHIYISPHLRISLCLYTYILLYNYIYILYIYICIYYYSIYNIRIYIFIFIYTINTSMCLFWTKNLYCLSYISKTCATEKQVLWHVYPQRNARRITEINPGLGGYDEGWHQTLGGVLDVFGALHEDIHTMQIGMIYIYMYISSIVYL